VFIHNLKTYEVTNQYTRVRQLLTYYWSNTWYAS